MLSNRMLQLYQRLLCNRILLVAKLMMVDRHFVLLLHRNSPSKLLDFGNLLLDSGILLRF